jgi:hypothetical protein
MSFYSFIKDTFTVQKKKKPEEKKVNRIDLRGMMEELGVRSDTTIGTYEEEENPDDLTISQYIRMQNNDGTVRAITRLFAMPIQSTQIKILPEAGGSKEKEFIETVLMGPQYEGGMSMPLPFIIADMTRAMFEGYRLYEKVAQVIKQGPYKGLIGWRKLAIRNSETIKIRSDEKGGFLGAHQTASFGMKTVDINIPPEKCFLFTFQKERHPLYGESILKTAYYHYDKKHKLYYLAHKKAEMDAVGLKILKLSKPISEAEVEAAETAIDSIGANTRVTIPQGFDLEINRATSGYDVMGLIRHHDSQILISTLTQAMNLGSSGQYDYPYGSGYKTQSQFIMQMLESVMRSIEYTINEWVIPPLIDWNFGTGKYPKMKMMPLKDEVQSYLFAIFEDLIKKDPALIPPDFLSKITNDVAERLGIEFKQDTSKNAALKAFEIGKKTRADVLKVLAPATSKEIKLQIAKQAEQWKGAPDFLEKFELMGKQFVENNSTK